METRDCLHRRRPTEGRLNQVFQRGDANDESKPNGFDKALINTSQMRETWADSPSWPLLRYQDRGHWHKAQLVVLGAKEDVDIIEIRNILPIQCNVLGKHQRIAAEIRANNRDDDPDTRSNICHPLTGTQHPKRVLANLNRREPLVMLNAGSHKRSYRHRVASFSNIHNL
jgi:hypothetical protein